MEAKTIYNRMRWLLRAARTLHGTADRRVRQAEQAMPHLRKALRLEPIERPLSGYAYPRKQGTGYPCE